LTANGLLDDARPSPHKLVGVVPPFESVPVLSLTSPLAAQELALHR
jgi:hypothetical protein